MQRGAAVMLWAWLAVSSWAAEISPETIRKIAPNVAEKDELRHQWRDDLRARLKQANAESSAAWRKCTDRASWEKHRDACIAALKKSLGEWPTTRCPLAPRTTGTIAGDGYVIEKVIYESRPGLFVTANLYRPDSPPPSPPGILLSHSHHSPKSQGELQEMGQLWARAGCLVLVPDHLGHGERRQHPFATAADYPEKFQVGRQDYYFRYNLGLQLDVAGESLMGWLAWDLSRGIDYLLERGADEKKLILLGGVAGGGDPAAVTAALDDRIDAVLPMNFGGPQPETKYPLPDDAETSFNYVGSGGWESTRNLRGSAAGGFVPWVIVGSVAPRKLIHGHEFAWDRERDPVWKRYEKIYGFYDAADDLDFTHGHGVLQQSEAEASHCGNIGQEHRQRVHAAFKRWFGLEVKDSPEDRASLKKRSAEELRCVPEGEKLPSALPVIAALAQRRSETFVQSIADLTAGERRHKLRAAWSQRLGNVEPYLLTSHTSTVEEREGLRIERFLLSGPRQSQIPLLVLRKSGQDRLPVVVAVAQYGKEFILRQRADDVAALLQRNAVCLVDIRETGEGVLGSYRGRRSEATDRSSSLQMLGETAMGVKLRDLRSVIAWLRNRPDLAADRPAIWGDGMQVAESELANSRRRDVRPPFAMPLELEQREAVDALGGTLALLAGLYEDRAAALVVRSGLLRYQSYFHSPFLTSPHDLALPGGATCGDLLYLREQLVPPLDALNTVAAGDEDSRTHDLRKAPLTIAASLERRLPGDATLEAVDTILHHGKIITVNRDFKIAEAIALAGERILAVGSNEDVLKLKTGDTKLIDLRGQTVLPGLIDSHTHPTGAALHEFDHDIPEMETIDDVLKYVKSRAAALPEGKWIIVRQVFITRLREPRYPTKAELDDAAPKHPVVFSTGPDAMLNSLALAKSGIDRDLKTNGAAFIERDANGDPTGLLRNAGRYIKSEPHGRSPTEAERLARLEQLFADYNSVGLTSIADRNASGGDLVHFRHLRDQNKLNLRIAASYGVDGQSKTDDAVAAIREVARHPLRAADPRLRVVGIKMFLDGGMLTGSAFMRQPWGVSQTYSITDHEYRGIRFIDAEKLETFVRTAAENDLQFTAHSVGDGAVHALLDAYTAVNKSLPIAKTRPCLTHSNFMSLEAVERMAPLGVVADIQPAWLYLDARVLTKQFGAERLRYFQPLRTIFEKGAVAGGGSDHMQKIGSLRSVNPYNPWLGMWTTITRRARWYDDQQLHPEEALSREQAIRFYTANNAWICFLDQVAGSLEPGKLADLIVIDRDILTCPVDEIRETQVLRTMVGGKWVFERK